MSERLDTEARKLIDLRTDYTTKDRAAKRAKEKKESQERVVDDIMKEEKTKTTVLELGGDYGDVQFGRRETVTSRVIDEEAALDAFEKEARVDEVTKTGFRKKPLNELVRERLLTGQPLPPGVDFIRKPYIEVTRKTKRKR